MDLDGKFFVCLSCADRKVHNFNISKKPNPLVFFSSYPNEQTVYAFSVKRGVADVSSGSDLIKDAESEEAFTMKLFYNPIDIWVPNNVIYLSNNKGLNLKYSRVRKALRDTKKFYPSIQFYE